MHRDFRKYLDQAQGGSELVIVANVDVRDFTGFAGRGMEPVQATLFIKTVYRRLFDEFFVDATFVKSTGDGLLVVYRHDEQQLAETEAAVVDAAVRAVREFPDFCSGEALVNFEVPSRLGVGISRGAASRLATKRKVLDYFGMPLNLATRLMDFARPEGIVIDDIAALPAHQQAYFNQASVFVRGMDESEPRTVHYTPEWTSIPAYARTPLVQPSWTTDQYDYTLNELESLAQSGTASAIRLRHAPEGAAVQVELEYPATRSGGRRSASHTRGRQLREGRDFFLTNFAGEYSLRINAATVAQQLRERNVKGTWPLRVKIALPSLPRPRPLPRKSRGKKGPPPRPMSLT